MPFGTCAQFTYTFMVAYRYLVWFTASLGGCMLIIMVLNARKQCIFSGIPSLRTCARTKLSDVYIMRYIMQRQTELGTYMLSTSETTIIYQPFSTLFTPMTCSCIPVDPFEGFVRQLCILAVYCQGTGNKPFFKSPF